MTRNY